MRPRRRQLKLIARFNFKRGHPLPEIDLSRVRSAVYSSDVHRDKWKHSQLLHARLFLLWGADCVVTDVKKNGLFRWQASSLLSLHVSVLKHPQDGSIVSEWSNEHWGHFCTHGPQFFQCFFFLFFFFSQLTNDFNTHGWVKWVDASVSPWAKQRENAWELPVGPKRSWQKPMPVQKGCSENTQFNKQRQRQLRSRGPNSLINST